MPRILLVDDNPAIRRSLRSLLTPQTDWEICGEAENGKMAVEMVRTLSPDVVILDLSMPVLDGREFLRLRASDPILRDIPVVVVSGSNQPSEPLPGIDEYLRKPVKFERLMEIINHYR